MHRFYVAAFCFVAIPLVHLVKPAVSPQPSAGTEAAPTSVALRGDEAATAPVFHGDKPAR
ncbi:MAG: hypothetical protein JWP87_6264 [Labilithrix sp.]|nr:hypothetical protein [Labilithrix sp.]